MIPYQAQTAVAIYFLSGLSEAIAADFVKLKSTDFQGDPFAFVVYLFIEMPLDKVFRLEMSESTTESRAHAAAVKFSAQRRNFGLRKTLELQLWRGTELQGHGD